MSFTNVLTNIFFPFGIKRKELLSNTKELRTLFIRLKETNEELKRWKDRYQRLVETTSDWSWEIDYSGKIVWTSKNIINHLGYTHTEVIGQHLWDFEPKECSHDCKKMFLGNMKNAIPIISRKCRFQRQDGKIRIYNIFGIPIIEEGEVNGYFGCSRDVTEVCTSRARLEAFFKSSQDPMTIINMDTGIILDVNPSLCTILEYNKEDIIGKHLVEFSAEPEESSRCLREKVSYVPKRFYRTKSGKLIPTEVFLSYYKDAGDNYAAVVCRVIEEEENEIY